MQYDRRDFLKFLGVSSASFSLFASCDFIDKKQRKIKSISPSSQDELKLHHELTYKILIKYNDPINSEEVFGFNNDYIEIVQNTSPTDLLMWVNHEYIHPLFVSGYERTKENVDKERKLVGGSIIHIQKKEDSWQVLKNSPYNRGVRGDKKIAFANNKKIKGSRYGEGTLANCAGGKTPWGNYLTCEENYHDFYGERQEDGKIRPSRMGWEKFYPNPPEHYGWVVEVEPKTGKAKKHITLGRFAHECAKCVTTKKGNVVVYSGDDKNDEHLYKFISKSSTNFDEGILYVANTDEGKWIPLTLSNPLLKKRFKTQEDIFTYARVAAKLVGATPLARPEDIEVSPINGAIFVALTNNKERDNYHGQILKLEEDGGDYNSLSFKSSHFVTGGKKGELSCPDNLCFDKVGNLWITTDISGSAMNKPPYNDFKNNGLFVIPAKGPDAGRVIQVASAPTDAEFTGPCFSPDYSTLFLSVQHPGERSKSLDKLTSHWPTGNIPAPAVICIEGRFLSDIMS